MSSGRMTGTNWVLEPGKFLSLEEAKKLLETARERAAAATACKAKAGHIIANNFCPFLELKFAFISIKISFLECRNSYCGFLPLELSDLSAADKNKL